MTSIDGNPSSDRLARAGLMNRREAVRRVTFLLGGTTLIGGNALLAACSRDADRGVTSVGTFTADDIALLDEIADTLLPETSTPGARAAGVGPFMALMATDTYDADEQSIFREGMRTLEEASRELNGASFLEATPEQRLALLEQLDREQHEYMTARGAAQRRRALAAVRDTTQVADSAAAQPNAGDAFLPDQRQENAAASGTASAAPAITADAPPHYFRMMKELALLGFFTSEIGYTQVQRYEETPGRFEPCVDYTAGEAAWAPHA